MTTAAIALLLMFFLERDRATDRRILRMSAALDALKVSQASLHAAVSTASGKLADLAAQVAAIKPAAPDEGPDVAAIAADIQAQADALQAASAAAQPAPTAPAQPTP